MKAVLSGALVLLMTVVLYGGQIMCVDTDSEDVYFNVSKIDSITFLGDSITDVRDGQRYAIVLIGKQVWMAENLNYGTRIDGSVDQTNNTVVEKYAYHNHPAYADTFGGLYQWHEAMNYSTTEGAQGICPNGWHIPTDAEWMTLEMYLGMSLADANRDQYRGTDQGTQLKKGGSSGFQALLSGYRFYAVFLERDSSTYFWSSSLYNASGMWIRLLLHDDPRVLKYLYTKDATEGLCVRCVRD